MGEGIGGEGEGVVKCVVNFVWTFEYGSTVIGKDRLLE